MKYLPLLIENPNYDRRVQLGDFKFLFDFEWNETIQSWHMDMTCLSEDFEVTGVRLVKGEDLFGVYSRRYGQLWLVGPDDRPTFESLGDTHKLVWVPEDEAVNV